MLAVVLESQTLGELKMVPSLICEKKRQDENITLKNIRICKCFAILKYGFFFPFFYKYEYEWIDLVICIMQNSLGFQKS